MGNYKNNLILAVKFLVIAGETAMFFLVFAFFFISAFTFISPIELILLLLIVWLALFPFIAQKTYTFLWSEKGDAVETNSQTRNQNDRQGTDF